MVGILRIEAGSGRSAMAPKSSRIEASACGIGTDCAGAQEVVDLRGRLAAVAAQPGTRLDVGAEQLAHPVVAETGPMADGVGAGLVPQQPQGEFEAQSVTLVTFVGQVHGLLLGWSCVA
jgi:hypothetical protein